MLTAQSRFDKLYDKLSDVSSKGSLPDLEYVVDVLMSVDENHQELFLAKFSQALTFRKTKSVSRAVHKGVGSY